MKKKKFVLAFLVIGISMYLLHLYAAPLFFIVLAIMGAGLAIVWGASGRFPEEIVGLIIGQAMLCIALLNL